MKSIKIILTILILAVFATISYSQSVTFKKVVPAFSIDPVDFYVFCKPFNNDKTFLITGSGMRLTKINEYGVITLSKNYLNYGYFIHSCFNNNGIITFYSDDGNNKKLLKLDTSFNFISAKQYDSINWWQATDRSVIYPTFNNGFLLSGGKGILMPLIVITDSLHNVLWGKYFTPIQGGIQDIVQTKDSGFAIAVNLRNATASLIKTTKNGNVLWAKSYFRPHGYIHNVLENADGTMMITGTIDSSQASAPLFFVKLDQSGNIIWAKTFGNTVNNIRNYASYTKHTQDGGYITLATLYKNHYDLLLIKTDSNGDTLWVRVHGSPNSMEYGQSVEQLNDKGYIVAGITNNNIPVPLSSLYLIRTDSLGHTDSLCEEYGLPLAMNNITVNDSNITVTSVPFTIHTSVADSSTQSYINYIYDGCVLDNIPELYAEQTAPLLIYPNPTDGLFSIETKMSAPLKTDIEIYNINGERVYSAVTNESLTSINLTGYPKGLYFIKLSNERWVKSGKVMVY